MQFAVCSFLISPVHFLLERAAILEEHGRLDLPFQREQERKGNIRPLWQQERSLEVTSSFTQEIYKNKG